jgi:hypothetical protein
MNNATYDECVAACEAGAYTWCRWTPAEMCDFDEVCDGPNAVLIEGCADPIPTVSQWGLIVLALLLLIAGTIVALRRRPALADQAAR